MFWTIVGAILFISIGIPIIIGIFSMIFGGIASVFDSPTSTPREKTRIANRNIITNVLSEMGYQSTSQLNPQGDKEKFKRSMEVYYKRLPSLITPKTDILDKTPAEDLAEAFFRITQLNSALRTISDYMDEKIMNTVIQGKVKKLPRDNSFDFSIPINKELEVRVGNLKTSYSETSYSSVSNPYGENTEKQRGFVVLNATNTVLDATLKYRGYGGGGTYWISTFKPNTWILDILKVAHDYEEKKELKKKQDEIKRQKSKYLQ